LAPVVASPKRCSVDINLVLKREHLELALKIVDEVTDHYLMGNKTLAPVQIPPELEMLSPQDWQVLSVILHLLKQEQQSSRVH
jgi:hypothetical protein